MATKKLIEVALPLEKINAESGREKSIRHGHPSTLHLWWARRPLAAARAVIWASLVDDPSSHPELYPDEETQNIERNRLFRILEDLVVWENSDNEVVLNAARDEIMKSNGNTTLSFLDPFSGGGAIPLEAGRLGLDTHAHDLNPIPVLINKSMLEMPEKFAGCSPINPDKQDSISQGIQWNGVEGLAEDVEFYGNEIKRIAFERMGHLYPQLKLSKKDGGGSVPVIAWLWSRTIKCPNPACGCQMPLLKSNVIAKNIAYLEIGKTEDGQPAFEVKYGVPKKEEGTVNRKGARCIYCGTSVGFPYIREEGKAHRMSAKMMAIVGKGRNGRVYGSPYEEHEMSSKDFQKKDIVLGDIANYPGYLNPPAYGLETFESLFTDRQLFFIDEMCHILQEVALNAEKDAVKAGFANDHIGLEQGGRGALAYSQAIKVYLSYMIDKIADYHTSICSWNAVGQKMRNTFGLTGMSMSWDYAEANPFSGASGSFDNMLDWVVRSVKKLPIVNHSVANQKNAQVDSGLRNVVISTDPPYYSNVPYADFADFFYVWLRRNLNDVYPGLFRTMLTPKSEELVADPYRLGGKDAAATYFEDGMLQACKQIYLSATEDVPVTIYYAFKESDVNSDQASSTGWETMLSAIIQAGFSIVGTWPIRTEMSSRTRGIGSNALASSIVLVCRKRPEDAPQTTRRNLINALRRELRPSLKQLQVSNIAPVDLAQSAIGPGIGVYSKYSQVLEADGKPMTVRSALQVINQELDLYFNEQDGELDTESRFCVDLYSQMAFNVMPFGDANTLATAKNTSVAIMASHGTLYAQKGKVHLIERPELPTKIDEHEGSIWLLCQQLTYKMEKEGIEGCATAIANMYGSNAERAKDLAYRLYTIAERKKWAQEAYAYNALVVAWPEIQSRAAELKAIVPQQLTLEDFMNNNN